jgi:hypothetical protein
MATDFAPNTNRAVQRAPISFHHSDHQMDAVLSGTFGQLIGLGAIPLNGRLEIAGKLVSAFGASHAQLYAEIQPLWVAANESFCMTIWVVNF